MITLRPYQQRFIENIREAMTRNKHLICQMSTGGGKCLGKDTPILMYDGSIKLVQDVQVGDVIMGDDSTPRNVLSLARGEEMMYKVTPIKGDPFTCNESHILSLQTNCKTTIYDKGEVVNVSIKDYIQWTKTQKHCAKLYRTSIEFDHKPTAIDPWLVGLWLSKGKKTNADPIFYINSLDTEIIDEIIKYNPSYIKDDNIRGTCKRISFLNLGNKGVKHFSNIYREEFKKFLFSGNSKDIFIPDEYKINSKEVRLGLLAGIVDGDGYMKNNCLEIATKFKRMGEDIVYIARSVGLAAYKSDKYVNGVRYYRILISGDLSIIPNKLSRKHGTKRTHKSNVLRTGFSLEQIGVGDYYGFEIDGNRLFVLGDFTVTHNTVIFSYISQQALLKGTRILILSNRCELLTQAGGTLEKFGIKAEYISPKHRKVPTGNIVVSMAQTLQKRYQKEEWDAYLRTVDVVVLDEAHFASFDFILDYSDPKSIGYHLRSKYVLGFTATPLRTGKMRQLGLDYDEIVFSEDVKSMIEMGFLVPARTFTIDAPDLSKVEKDYRTGDYNMAQMGMAFNKKAVYTGLIKNYNTICPDTKAVCFCSSQLHSIQTCVELNNAGISAMFLISGFDSSKDEALAIYEQYKDYTFHKDGKYRTREGLLKGFADGEFKTMVNSGILTTGYDCPSIETVIMNRATTSVTLLLQSYGRGARLYEGKKYFTILDLGGNTKEHGVYDAPRQWGLWHKEGASNGISPTKECPPEKGGCAKIIPVSAGECPFCGHVFETKKEIREAELVEIIDGKFEYKDMTLEQLCAVQELKGYHRGWVFRQVYMGSGAAGLRKSMRELGYDNRYIWGTVKRLEGK